MKERVMTIDEAIKHCEKVASGHDRNCEIFIEDSELWQINKEWADNYHNIAEWLRELKKYRAIFEKVGKILADNGYTIDDLDTIFGKANEEGKR
jgi:hypothetical protein